MRVYIYVSYECYCCFMSWVIDSCANRFMSLHVEMFRRATMMRPMCNVTVSKLLVNLYVNRLKLHCLSFNTKVL